MEAATRWVEFAKQEDCPLHLDPAGIQGQHTPTIEIKVLDEEGKVESTWTVPDEH